MSDRPSHAQISEAYMKGWLAGDVGAPKHLCRMAAVTRRRRFFAVTGSPGGMIETWRRLMDSEPSGFVSLAFV